MYNTEDHGKKRPSHSKQPSQTQTGPRLYDPDDTTYYEPTSENVSLQLLIDSHNEQVKVSEIHKEIALDKL